MITLQHRNLNDAIPHLVDLLKKVGKTHHLSDRIWFPESVELVLEHPEECLVFHKRLLVNPWDLLANALWAIFGTNGRNPVDSDRGDVLDPWTKHSDVLPILRRLATGLLKTEPHLQLLRSDFGGLVTDAPIWGVVHQLERRDSLHVVLTRFGEKLTTVENFSGTDVGYAGSPGRTAFGGMPVPMLQVEDWRKFIVEAREAIPLLHRKQVDWREFSFDRDARAHAREVQQSYQELVLPEFQEPFFRGLGDFIKAQWMRDSEINFRDGLRKAISVVEDRSFDWYLLAEREMKGCLFLES